MNLILKTHHLYSSYYDQLVLDNINLEIPTGNICALVGPNGAGKTTLIECLLGIQKPLMGEILFNNNVKQNNDNIGYVSQKKTVDWNFPITVFEVVEMAHFGKDLTKEEKFENTEQALKKVGLWDLKNSHIKELSGGQQQRIFIARALAIDADLYIMDEPFAGVDKKTEHLIIDLFRELKSLGKTLLIVHHDWATLSDYFEWIIFLNKKIIYQGTLEKESLDKHIQKTFE